MKRDIVRARVVLAIDGEASCGAIRKVLEDLGCSVTEARTGKEAALSALAERPLFILVCLDSVEYDWLGAVSDFRGNRFLRHIPIIATSKDGAKGIELFVKIRELGEDLIEYLPQPISANELDFQIEHLIAGRKSAAH